MILDQLDVRQREIGIQQHREPGPRGCAKRADRPAAVPSHLHGRKQDARILREQTLDAEQKKYALGASTIFNVILVQRDLAVAQSAEVNALEHLQPGQGSTRHGHRSDAEQQQCLHRGGVPWFGVPLTFAFASGKTVKVKPRKTPHPSADLVQAFTIRNQVWSRAWVESCFKLE